MKNIYENLKNSSRFFKLLEKWGYIHPIVEILYGAHMLRIQTVYNGFHPLS